MRLIGLILALLSLGLSAPAWAWREEIHHIPAPAPAHAPVGASAGQTVRMVTRICWPDRPGPHAVVVINHGKAAKVADRALTKPALCNSEAVSWFLNRGYIAVMPIRRGYGETGGLLAENPGPCSDKRDYARSALAGAQDIAAVVEHAATLAGAKPSGMVVLGQSAGGIATVAYNSLPHPRVSAMISMAGGDGGHRNNTPGENCRPDLLALAAQRLAANAVTPMLWVYTENDSFFGPSVALPMRDAYLRGGGKLTFVNPGPFAKDGHALFFGKGGSAIWGTLVERYLAEVGARH
jgi:dienelactone hydrolase